MIKKRGNIIIVVHATIPESFSKKATKQPTATVNRAMYNFSSRLICFKKFSLANVTADMINTDKKVILAHIPTFMRLRFIFTFL